MNIIVTPRLLLRPFEAADLDAVAGLYGDDEVMRFIGSARSREESAKKLQQMIAEFSAKGFGMFAVIDRKEKRFIGRCGLQTLDQTDLIELGYTFIRSAWGKGYATESSKAILRKAFDQWGLDSVVAVTSPEHIASRHVMEKAGMTYERTDTFYGRSCVVYSISKKKQSQPSTRPFYEPMKEFTSNFLHFRTK